VPADRKDNLGCVASGRSLPGSIMSEAATGPIEPSLAEGLDLARDPAKFEGKEYGQGSRGPPQERLASLKGAELR
jgi:hypothetical protein